MSLCQRMLILNKKVQTTYTFFWLYKVRTLELFQNDEVLYDELCKKGFQVLKFGLLTRFEHFLKILLTLLKFFVYTANFRTNFWNFSHCIMI